MLVCGAKYTRVTGKWILYEYTDSSILSSFPVHQSAFKKIIYKLTPILYFRYDTSKPDSFYDNSPQRRTLEDLKNCCTNKKSKKNFCSVHPPLLDIPLDHIILDELHLLLRVTDVLTRNIIDEMIEWDDEDAHKNKVYNPAAIGHHLQKAIDTINKCGVTFHVWEKKNANGKGSGTYDWTSLMGNEKKQLLKSIPDHFPSFLHKETVTTVQKIWNVCKVS